MRFIILIIFISLIDYNLYAQFSLSASSETGYETNVYFQKDSTYKNAFYLMPSVEPSYEAALNRTWIFEASAPFSFTLRRQGNNDKSAEGNAALIHKWKNNSLKFSGGVAYSAFPGSIDPDQPLSDMQYRFTTEYTERASYTLKIAYIFSYTDAINNPRTDLKNKARLKMSFHPSPKLSPGFSIGTGYDKTSGSGFDYYEIDGSILATLTPDDKNMLMAIVYINHRSYDVPETMVTGSVSGSTVNNKGKVKDRPVAFTSSETNNSSLNLLFSFSYTREINNYWEICGGYDFLSFINENETIASHKISLGFTLRLGSM